MSGKQREGDAGWLNYEADTPQTAEADADPGIQDPAEGTTDSPWLRHDLPVPDGPADGGDDGDADAAGAPRDAAWLAPELEVAPERPTAEEVHDTGVPPTLVEPGPPVPPVTQQVPPVSQPAPRVTPAVAPVTHPALAVNGHDLATGPRSAGEAPPSDDGHAPQRAPEKDTEQDADDEQVGGLAVLGAAVKEFAIVVGMALVLSFIVKTWLLQAFYIPSGSMEDTLVLNDRVIVSKLTPGPVDLKRGDIVVFADPGEWLDEAPAKKQGPVATVVTETLTFVGLLPDNAENHLIKRVIGLPGDKVVCCDAGGRITINGTAIKEPYLKPGDAASEQDFSITVPRGRVWVMGDHRSNSADSRVHDGPENDGSQGSVDERLIVGRAVALVWPLDHLTWLSNPSATFAHVPPPEPDGETPPADDSGTGVGDGTDSDGGDEVGGTDTDAPTGVG